MSDPLDRDFAESSALERFEASIYALAAVRQVVAAAGQSMHDEQAIDRSLASVQTLLNLLIGKGICDFAEFADQFAWVVSQRCQVAVKAHEHHTFGELIAELEADLAANPETGLKGADDDEH